MTVGCGATMELNSGRVLRPLVKYLILLHTQHKSPKMHKIAGTPTPTVMAYRALLGIPELAIRIYIILESENSV